MRPSVKENIWVKYHSDISLSIRDDIELEFYYTIVDRYKIFEMTVMLNNIINIVETSVGL